MMSLASQLTRVYYDYETWHETRLPEEEADRYHETLIKNGNIISVHDGDVLVGYTEFWRITFEQFGRLICHESVFPMVEDVVSGYIGHIHNVWVHPEYRDKGILKLMRNRFFDRCKDCKFFVGQALRKKTQPVKVFRVSDIHLKGATNGR